MHNEQGIRLWVDDLRPAPDDSWTVCRTITEAIRMIDEQWGSITHISLDHDAGGEETYEPVARFIKRIRTVSHYEFLEPVEKWWDITIIIHSQNPVGAQKLKDILGI